MFDRVRQADDDDRYEVGDLVWRRVAKSDKLDAAYSQVVYKVVGKRHYTKVRRPTGYRIQLLTASTPEAVAKQRERRRERAVAGRPLEAHIGPRGDPEGGAERGARGRLAQLPCGDIVSHHWIVLIETHCNVIGAPIPREPVTPVVIHIAF